MSLYGVTKGTELEKKIDTLSEGEARGGAIYTAMALLAEEKGFREIGEELRKIAFDETRHAGMYALLNGRVDKDLFSFMKEFAALESRAPEKLRELIGLIRSTAGEEAARLIETTVPDEARHGEVLARLVERYGADRVEVVL